MSYAANIIINPPTHTNGSEGKLQTTLRCLADTKWMLSSNIQFYAANQSSLYSSIILQYSFSSQSI